MDPDPVGASFGEVTATTYIAFGCVGIITSGGARDTEPLRKRRFPLFARSRNVSHGYPHCQAVNVPVEVGGVCIRPGDFLHADANGVTTVPLEQVEQIALLCEEFIAAEREWLGYVDSDHVTPDGVSAALAKFNQFKIRAGNVCAARWPEPTRQPQVRRRLERRRQSPDKEFAAGASHESSQ